MEAALRQSDCSFLCSSGMFGFFLPTNTSHQSVPPFPLVKGKVRLPEKNDSKF